MRIGINALFLLPGRTGGVEAYLRSLLRVLQNVDHDDEFVVFSNDETAGTFDLHAANFSEVRCGVQASSSPLRVVWEQALLPMQIRRARLDVLHSPGYTAPLWPGIANVVTLHDLNYHYFPDDWPTTSLWTMRLLIPRIARAATRIITVSHHSEQSIRSVLGVDGSAIDVVYHGVDGNLTPPIAGEEEMVRTRYGLDGPFLLSVCASHPHKNPDGLLLAYHEACEGWEAPPPLVIVGIRGRYQDAIEARLRTLRGSGRVVLTGWIESSALSALYRSAHLFVFASKYEGFGFPVLEAMAAGLPVISSNAASLPEVVGNAGVLVDPDDVRGIAAAIRRLWDAEDVRRDYIGRARDRAASFTWRQAAEETLASYRRAWRQQSPT